MLKNIHKASSFQHSTWLEINASSCKLVHLWVDGKHLLHGLVVTWSLPWFFDSFDVFIFEYWGAYTVGGAKRTDETDVMFKGMLVREVEVGTNSCGEKNLSILVEVIESISHLCDALRINNVATGNIANINKCSDGVDDVWWYIHSRKFELETRFVLEFLANSNILNRSFPTNLGSILQRNPVCGQVCKLPRNLSIVRVWLLYRTLVCIAISK